jgi:chemotaxis protein CheD
MMVLDPGRHNWPPILPQFKKLQRRWHPRFGKCTIKLMPGEYYVSAHDELISTVLGSCVSACIRDPDTGVGGMNHFMLPGCEQSCNSKWGGAKALPTRFGVPAMRMLVDDIMRVGARKSRLEVKLFGGGAVMAMDANNVGERNIEFALEFMRREGLNVVAQDLGGDHPRKVKYFPRSGRVMVKRMRSQNTQDLINEEQQFQRMFQS